MASSSCCPSWMQSVSRNSVTRYRHPSHRSPSLPDFSSSSAMEGRAFFPVYAFEPSEFVCTCDKLPFASARRKGPTVLMDEPEEKVRNAVWHINDAIQTFPKRVATHQKLCFLRDVPFDCPWHTALKERGLRRSIEIPAKSLVSFNTAIRRFPPHQRQQAQ